LPLLSLWETNSKAVSEFSIEQVVATAGDGSLKDGSLCSNELRAYLAQIPSEKIAIYVSQCLASKIEKGGIILQDLVNELARRLDYEVSNGRYQGTTNAVGYDGLWKSPEGATVVTEIKTTDAYRIALDTIASYREKLLAAGTITGRSSILIVVGRQDTGELEAQIRGSRHAWDVRLISAEALIKLVLLKEKSDEPETGKKIRSVLIPLEYTRLDALVDVMFTAATDAVEDVGRLDAAPVQKFSPVKSAPAASEGVTGVWEFTDPRLLQQKRDQIVKAIALRMGAPLIKKSRALFWSADHAKRIACTMSKKYTKRGAYPYWYAYHPDWDDWLEKGDEAYLVLGCMDLTEAFAIPHNVLREILPHLNMTEMERGTMYWHIHITQNATGEYAIMLPKREENLLISPYAIDLGPRTDDPAKTQ
jgi:hypothetical protein